MPVIENAMEVVEHFVKNFAKDGQWAETGSKLTDLQQAFNASIERAMTLSDAATVIQRLDCVKRCVEATLAATAVAAMQQSDKSYPMSTQSADALCDLHNKCSSLKAKPI